MRVVYKTIRQQVEDVINLALEMGELNQIDRIMLTPNEMTMFLTQVLWVKPQKTTEPLWKKELEEGYLYRGIRIVREENHDEEDF